MNIGTRVRNRENRKEGTVIQDSFQCCSPEEELIVYDGTNTGLGTDRGFLLEIVSEVEIPDLKGCGAGRGEQCCIFLTVGLEANCERFTSLRDSLIFKTMNAKRNPEEPYPACMIFKDF